MYRTYLGDFRSAINQHRTPIVLALVCTAIILLIAYQLDTIGPQFSLQPIPYLIGLGGLAIHLIYPGRVPLVGWLWWSAGILTCFWSDSPGSTINTALWELLYLAAFIVGRTQYSAGLILIVLLLNGLYSNLVSIIITGPSYLSGSDLYTSAAQALPLLPVLIVSLIRSPRYKVPTFTVTLLATYIIVISGSRSVTFPMVIVAITTLIVLKRSGITTFILSLAVISTLVGVVAIDGIVPKHPLTAAILTKGKMTATVADAQEGGNLQTRLQMWEATTDLAIQRPLGIGNGAYADGFQHYLRWPVYFSRFSHNYYLETAATGGWIRLVILILLLGFTLHTGWRRGHWQWVLGAAGIWLSLFTDITGDMPPVMIVAFIALGAAYGPVQQVQGRGKTSGHHKHQLSSCAKFLVLISLTLAWFWPLRTLGSPLQQSLGWLPAVKLQLAAAPLNQTTRLLDEAVNKNQNVFEFYKLKLLESKTPKERDVILQQMIDRFPYSYLRLYIEAAATKEELGEVSAARRVLQEGIERFSRKESPLGFKLTPYKNKELLDIAQTKLKKLSDKTN